jgi:hypothetical protein
MARTLFQPRRYGGNWPEVRVSPSRYGVRYMGFRAHQKFGRATVGADPDVWTGGVLQEENLETAALGLAPMYPAYLWSVKDSPGHHGYERAFDLISSKASAAKPQTRAVRVTSSRLRREDRSSIALFHTLTDLGGKGRQGMMAPS